MPAQQAGGLASAPPLGRAARWGLRRLTASQRWMATAAGWAGQEVLVPAAQDHAEVMSRFGGQAFGVDEPEGRVGAVVDTVWHL
jgi:hypothetical protein